MSRFCLTLLIGSLLTGVSHAQWLPPAQPGYQWVEVTSGPVSTASNVCAKCGRVRGTSSVSNTRSPSRGVAQQRANFMAQRGIYMRHITRSEEFRYGIPNYTLAGGSYEGVGWGSTPQQAIDMCCGSGKPGSKGAYRPNVVDVATARRPDGSYVAVRIAHNSTERRFQV